MPLFKYKKSLSAIDAAWYGMEDPTNLMMVSGILTFDGPVDYERLQATVSVATQQFHRFRQKVVDSPILRRPHWEDDLNFDLDNHLHRIALPEPGDTATLQEMIGDLMSRPLDFNRPPWQFYLIENYNGNSVLAGLLHHCMADGIALIYVLLSMTDEDPDAPLHDINKYKRRSRNPLYTAYKRTRQAAHNTRMLTGWVIHQSLKTMVHPGRVIDLAKMSLGGAASAGKLFLRTPDPKTIFKGELGIRKKAVWSAEVPLADVKAIRVAMGGTVNDVLLTAMAGALRRYMEYRGETVEQNLCFRAAVPVNLRPIEDAYKLGNQFGLVFLSLPIGLPDPVERLAQLKRNMDDLKNSPEAVVVFGALNAVGASPRDLQNLIIEFVGSKATTVMTNVPGPRKTIYMAGTAIKDLMFWVPQSARLGLGISIISYNNNVRLGVAVDAGLVPDPEVITDAFHDEFKSMMNLVHDAARFEDQKTPGLDI